MNCANDDMDSRTPLTKRSSDAFTLIELLVVIAIIGVLAGLILTAQSAITSKARRSRVETERDALILAIETFKKEKGFYPPDNTNNPAMPPLFYELTGSVFNPANSTFVSIATQGQFAPNDIQTLFGRNGFVNSSPDRSEVRDCVGTGKSRQTGTFTSGPLNYVLFGVPVPGPLATNSNEGKRISPWSYVATNPTNNQESYDLWLDVSYGGHNYRISNWSKDPQAQ
jgi:prepilin-type N-terminal cleavage/methylation domain-containing protein